jgi:hypothetical protein
VRVNSTHQPVNVLFPEAALYYGIPIVVKAIATSTNAVGLVPTGADTMDGQTGLSFTPVSSRTSYMFVSDGQNDWMLIATF